MLNQWLGQHLFKINIPVFAPFPSLPCNIKFVPSEHEVDTAFVGELREAGPHTHDINIRRHSNETHVPVFPISMGKKGGGGGGGGKNNNNDGKGGKGGGKGKGNNNNNAQASNSNNKKGGNNKNDDLKTCNHVKARHILCEKYSKINEAYEDLKEQYPGKIPPGKFGELAAKWSECSSGNSGGNLGWFPRGKMVAAFEEKAFNTPPGTVTPPFKSASGYHILLVEGRKA